VKIRPLCRNYESVLLCRNEFLPYTLFREFYHLWIESGGLLFVRDKFKGSAVFKCFQDKRGFDVLDSRNSRELVVNKIGITVHVFNLNLPEHPAAGN
jgi:hypothetical protein